MKTNLLLILFFITSFNFSQEKIIKNGDSWSYYESTDIDSNWKKNTEFQNWKKGATPIGYGDKKVVTEIYFGEEKENKHITKFFKKTININRNKYLAFEFKTQVDDGAVIYINGKELFRTNMPNSTINNKTLAVRTIKGDEESEFKINIFDNNIFNDGENTISVSVHQIYEGSSDCIFSLELLGHSSPEILSVVIENKNKNNILLEKKIENLNTQFNIDKLKLQKETLSSANYNLKTSLLIICFLLLLSIIGYFYLFGLIKRKEQSHSEKILQMNENNLTRDKDNLTLTSNLLHNKQYFKEIKADVKSLKTEDKTTQKNILNQIDFVLERDDDWKSLKQHFNAVFEGFYDRLSIKHPELSETELRHCLFIKLHLQTKEIARVLLIDPRSVQTARYRIKKKLKLNEETDLRDYLLKL